MINLFTSLNYTLNELWNTYYNVITVAYLTIKVSGSAAIISILIGIPSGMFLSLRQFPCRKLLVSFVNMGMGLPPVVVGLAVSLILWRYGPLGELSLMYTPTAMIIAQTLIASPIVAALSFSALAEYSQRLRPQLLALGASNWQAYWLIIREARLGLIAAVAAGFGRITSEVGASMMVGGNIKDQTRILTTATVTEVGMGNFQQAIFLSIVLLIITYSAIVLLTWLQNRKPRGLLNG